MRNSNTIGVDLAKNVIQVSVVTPANKELSNKELSRIKFAEFLAKQKPGLVAFEACATAHHWARLATTYGPPRIQEADSGRFVRRVSYMKERQTNIPASISRGI